VLTLARFSEAFLVLRAQNVGLPIALVPIVMVVMNVVYAIAAYPAGALSDAVGRNTMLALGVVFLIIADLVLAFATSITLILLGTAFWGLHMGFTQGPLAALVADTAPLKLRGTAFGLFNFACGIALLVASVIAGALWDAYGPTATFAAGALFSTLALAGLALVRPQLVAPAHRET
jgi:MFS family permease